MAGIHKLKQEEIEKARVGAIDRKTRKPVLRLNDGGGLFLLLGQAEDGTPRHRWRMTYYRPLTAEVSPGKENLLAFGYWPDVSLDQAREQAAAARKLVVAGIDPAADKKVKTEAAKAAAAAVNGEAEREAAGVLADDSFETVARDYYATAKAGWKDGDYKKKWIQRAEKDLFPMLGLKRLKDITDDEVLAALKLVQARGRIQLVHTLGGMVSKVFAHGRKFCKRPNPWAEIRDLFPAHVTTNHPAITSPKLLAEMVRKIMTLDSDVTRSAILLQVYTYQRPGNIADAEWSEMHLDEPEGQCYWAIPVGKLKGDLETEVNAGDQVHYVPLSTQAVNVLKLMKLRTGGRRFVFCVGKKNTPISKNTMSAAMRALGYRTKQVPHGFRATARTVLAERVGMDGEWIEAQLAHEKKGPLGTAYDRTKYVAQRFPMMQAWADYLDAIRTAPDNSPLFSPLAGAREYQIATGKAYNFGVPVAPAANVVPFPAAPAADGGVQMQLLATLLQTLPPEQVAALLQMAAKPAPLAA